VRVRHVIGSESARLRELRLAALARDAAAFGGTYARVAGRPPSWWERWARESGEGEVQRTFVVVDDEDRWLGLALVRPDDESPGDAVINAMWVAPEARRQGAGEALLDACVAWAAERRFRAVNLSVRISNAPARAAYAAAGFTFVRAERDEHVLTRRM
jgi:ribosomal protein S18 acetylase RimI-like enzyme